MIFDSTKVREIIKNRKKKTSNVIVSEKELMENAILFNKKLFFQTGKANNSPIKKIFP